MQKWSEIIQKDEYKTLPEIDKANARVRYFREVLSPQVPQEMQQDVMGAFFKDSAEMETEGPSVWEHMKATGKALYTVPAAIVGGLVQLPISGHAFVAAADKAKREGKPEPEMIKAGMTALRESQEVPMWWIKTPEEQKSLEAITFLLKWIDTASSYWGDAVFKKTGSADLASTTKTATDIATYFGLPALLGKLKASIKIGNASRIKEAAREIHRERLRILQEEPNRIDVLAQKEGKLRELEAWDIPKKSAEKSAEFIAAEIEKAVSKRGLQRHMEEIGAIREPQPVVPGMKAPYEPIPILEKGKPAPGYFGADTEAFLRKATETVRKQEPKVKAEYGIQERGIAMPEDVRGEFGQAKLVGNERPIFNALKDETGAIGINLPDTQVARHAKSLAKNKSWAKVHGMVGKEPKTGSRSGFFTRFNTGVFDRFAEIQKKSIAAYEEARIFSSHKDVAQLKFKELQEGLKEVRKDELLFTDYVAAHRALTRAQRGLKNPNGVTLQDAKTTINAIDTAWVDTGRPLGDLKTSFKNFQDWTDKYILQEARDSGIISSESYNKIKANNEFYAAFEVIDYLPQNINKIPVLPAKEYFSVSNQKIIQAMTGTEKKILNPIESTVKKFANAQAIFARNKVATVLIDDPAVQQFIRPVASSAKEFKIMESQGRNPVVEGGWSKAEFDTINRFKEGWVEKYLVPKGLADSMKQLTPWQAPRVVQGLNRVFRASATTLYLPFTISNAMRDGLMAYTTSKVHVSPATYAKDWIGGAWEGAKHEFLGKSNVVEEYIKSGGGFGYAGEIRNQPKIALFEKSLSRIGIDVITSPFKLIEKTSATIELAPRVGTFQRAKVRGYELKDAALTARSSTIDFNRGGVYTKVVNQFVPFLNARVQGRVTVATALKRSPASTGAKIFASIVVPGAGLYAWNRHYFSDLYDDIPEYIRQNYFCFITGKEVNEKGKTVPKYFVISKGDVGQIAWNPIEFGLDKMADKNPQAVQEFAINYLSDLSPVEFAREGKLSASKAAGGLLPPVVKVFAEDWANLKFYHGGEIVPYYMGKSKPPELQYKENTPESYKWLANQLKGVPGIPGVFKSPLRSQNFMSNILAGYGREGLDPKAMVRGLTGRLVKTTGGEKESQAWTVIKDIEQGYVYTRAYAEEMMKAGDREGAANLMQKWNAGLIEQIKQYNKQFEKYGFKDRGGLRRSYSFTPGKKRYIYRKGLRTRRSGIEERLRAR